MSLSSSELQIALLETLRFEMVEGYPFTRLNCKFNELISLSNIHQLTPLLLKSIKYGVNNGKYESKWLKSIQAVNIQYQRVHFQQVKRYSQCLDDLQRHFSIVPLKGMGLVLSEVYPQPFRTMRDMDIFIEESELLSVCHFLVKRGYDFKGYNKGNHFQNQIFRKHFHEDLEKGQLKHPHNPFSHYNTRGRESLSCGEMSIDLHWKSRYMIEGKAVDLPNPNRMSNIYREELLNFHFAHCVIHALDGYSPSLLQFIDAAFLWKATTEQRQKQLPPGIKSIELFIQALQDFYNIEISSENVLLRNNDIFSLLFNSDSQTTLKNRRNGWWLKKMDFLTKPKALHYLSSSEFLKESFLCALGRVFPSQFVSEESFDSL